MNKQNQEPRDENGLPHGEWVEYYPDGQVRFSRTFVHGKVNGKLLVYYDNGQLSYCKTYVDSKLHGDCLGYDSGGRMIFFDYRSNNLSCLYSYRSLTRLSLNL